MSSRGLGSENLAYLPARACTVRADHASLRWLLEIAEPLERLMRWRLRLAEVEIEVRYKKGKALSLY